MAEKEFDASGGGTGFTVTLIDLLMAQGMTQVQAAAVAASMQAGLPPGGPGGSDGTGLFGDLTNPVPGSGSAGLGGGSGGGGGGPSKAQLSQEMWGNFRASEWGMPFDVRPFVNEAVAKGLGFGYVKDRILNDPRFRQAFPGIFRNDGTLKMSPGQYLVAKDNYQAQATRFGVNLSVTQVGSLITNDVSADEFQFRLTAAETVRQNKAVFEAFNEMLTAQGRKDTLSNPKDAFNFVIGKARQDVYQIYEKASILAAAESAGVDINVHEATRLAQVLPEVNDFATAEAKFKMIADQLRMAGPELQSFGLSRNDLDTIAFGGPNRMELATKAEQALTQRKAQIQTNVAAPQLTSLDGRPVLESAKQTPQSF